MVIDQYDKFCSQSTKCLYEGMYKLATGCGFKFMPLCFRDTVMRLMKEVDSEGVQLRKGRRLKRRSYHSKVSCG